MSEQPRDDGNPVDDLVRQYLEHQAEQEECEPLIERVLGTIERTDTVKTKTRRVRTPASMRHQGLWTQSLWFVGAAATVLLAFVVGRWGQSARAEASVLVRAALATHAGPVERCYTVTVERESKDRSEFKPPRDVRLWTQGDRFWVEVDRGERRWAWGRNANGAVWTTLGPRRAVQIEPDELGRPLKYMTDLYALEFESMLQTILHRYRLERTSSTTTTHVITARPRGQRERWIREAVIEVDKETKAVRQLVLSRQLPERGVSVLTFTLVDARTPDESKYHPEGHLIEPFRIVASDVSVERRREFLVARFGSGAERWIESGPPTTDPKR